MSAAERGWDAAWDEMVAGVERDIGAVPSHTSMDGPDRVLADRIASLEARVLALEEGTIPVLGTVKPDGAVEMFHVARDGEDG